MPIYEFKSKNCDHVFEIIMSKTSGGTCPKCHSKKLDKQHSVFSAAVKKTVLSARQKFPRFANLALIDKIWQDPSR